MNENSLLDQLFTTDRLVLIFIKKKKRYLEKTRKRNTVKYPVFKPRIGEN